MTVGKKALVVEPEASSGEGFAILKEVSASIRSLAISRLRDARSVAQALRAGALAYVTIAESTATILQAYNSAIANERFVSPRAQSFLLREVSFGGLKGSSDADFLSPRERQIFVLLGEDAPAKAIAYDLHISEKTVRTHIERIKEKLSTYSLTDLEAAARSYVRQLRTSAENPGSVWTASTDDNHIAGVTRFSKDGSLAEQIANHRMAHGLTQKEFARQLGVDQVTVARWERGHRIPDGRFRKIVEAQLTGPSTKHGRAKERS